MKSFITLLALLTPYAVVLHAAPQPAVDWDGVQATYGSDHDGPFTLGFRFRADSDLMVSSLGVFDYQGDGLLTAHLVGVWSLNGGAPLAAVMVPSGISAPLLGAYRYAAIPDLSLVGNTEYIIGASDFYGDAFDIYPYNPQGVSFASGVTFLSPRETIDLTAGLVFPQFGDLRSAGAPTNLKALL